MLVGQRLTNERVGHGRALRASSPDGMLTQIMILDVGAVCRTSVLHIYACPPCTLVATDAVDGMRPYMSRPPNQCVHVTRRPYSVVSRGNATARRCRSAGTSCDIVQEAHSRRRRAHSARQGRWLPRLAQLVRSARSRCGAAREVRRTGRPDLVFAFHDSHGIGRRRSAHASRPRAGG